MENSSKFGLRQTALQASFDDIIRFHLILGTELATLNITDGLQQLFTRTEAPLQTLRNWGLRSFERSGLLKDWTVRQAMGLDR